jgi:beta-lactamase superfamily II metal-dependent hydrolase
MKLLFAFLVSLALASGAGKTFDVYIVDVEGGKCVLMVTPAGESLLIDTGWPASPQRDASTDRIVDAVKAAGLTQIDYLLTSHFDVDHLGDIPRLVARVPVRHLVDHGDYTLDNAAARRRYDAYAELFKTIPRIVVKPGDKLPVKGIEVEVLTAASNVIDKPLKGAGAPNPFCAANPRKAELMTDKEDNNSVGVLIAYGKFRMLDLADLEAYRAWELVCPNNLIGTVDVYQVNVHGQFKGIAPELIGAIRPTVAMMGNGAGKGGDLATWPVLRATPGLQDIWQSHFSVNGGKDNNPPDDFIANLEPSTPAPNDHWYKLKLSVASNGTYTITNERNGFSRSYQPRKQVQPKPAAE